MSTRLRRAGAVLITLVVVGLAAPAGAAQTTDPTVTLDRTGTVSGDEMLVTGAGWPEGSTVVVELCGHGGLSGAVDCDVPHQRTAGVGPSGTFSVQLITGKPPRPCPCVVKVTDQSSHIAATAPIAVAGIPTVAITDDDGTPERSVEISSIEVTGGGRLAELFGAGGRRVLEVTLVNTGAVPVEAPDVSVAWGTGSDPDGFVKPPETKPLEPGDTQTFTVGLDRPALTLGEQTAVVEVEGFGEEVVATASDSGYPWGLLLVALVVLQLLLLTLRNRFRRRHGGDALDDADGPDEMPLLPPGAIAALPPGPDLVIDVRDVEPEPLVAGVDDPEAEPVEFDHGGVTAPVGVLAATLAVGAVTNGHKASPYGNGAEAHGVVELLEPDLHTAAAAALTATLISDFASRTDALHGQIAAERERSSAALHRAVLLSEALVAAAEARTAEVRTATERREAEVNEKLAGAVEMLEQARAQAGELIDTAQRVAGEILAAAELERDAAQRALSDVERERDELVGAARETMRMATDDLHRRLTDLDSELQEHTTALLHAAGAERRQAPPIDELDRALARAVERAFTEV